jgi:hypothetical protein
MAHMEASSPMRYPSIPELTHATAKALQAENERLQRLLIELIQRISDLQSHDRNQIKNGSIDAKGLSKVRRVYH